MHAHKASALLVVGLTLVVATVSLLGGPFCVSGCSPLSNGTFAGSAPPSFAPAVAAPKPRVEILSPARGSFLAPGSVTVTGRTTPATSGSPGILSVDVNGVLAPLAPDGTFSTVTTLTEGLNVVRATVTDGGGDQGFTTAGVLAGTFSVGAPVPESVAIRLNPAGMSGFERIIEDQVNSLTSTQIGTTPLLDTGPGIVQLTASLGSIRYGPVSVHLEPRVGGLHLTATAPSPDVEIAAILILNGVPLNLETVVILADRLEVSATLEPTIDANHRLGVSVVGTTVSVPGLHIASASATILQLQTVIYTYAEAVIEAVVGVIIDQLTPPPVDPFAIDILGHDAMLDLRGETINSDASGLEAVLQLDVTAVTPTAAALACPGSFTTAGQAPVLQRGYGLEVSLRDDALNRLAFGLWSSGACHFDLAAFNAAQAAAAAAAPPVTTPPVSAPGSATALSASITSTDLKQVLPELSGVMPDGAPVNIVADALLPPVFRVAGPPDVLALEFGEVHLDLQVDRGNGFESLLKLSIHIFLSANVSLDSTGLRLSEGDTPRFVVDVIDMPIVAIDQRRIEIALALLLTPGVPYFLNQTKFPIPQFANLSVISASAFSDGPSLDFVSVLANLSR